MSTTDVRVLSAYLAPFLAGARVLYVGDLDDAAPLFAAGARLVHVYRATPPSTPLSGAVLVQSLARGLDLPSAGFDVAIVEDLASIEARLDLLAALRAGLGTRGIAALVARTGSGAIDYTELYDSCSTLFEHVKMVGKLPFTGTLLCELGLEGEPEVSVDTELAEVSAPDVLLALVSQRSFMLDEYAIFAHPVGGAPPGLAAAGAELPLLGEISELTLQNQALIAELKEERERRLDASSLRRELEVAVASSHAAREELEHLRASLDTTLRQQAELRASLEETLVERAELQNALETTQSERAELQRALDSSVMEQTHARTLELETSEVEIDKTLSELALQSERAEESEARAAASEAKLAKAERVVQNLERMQRELEQKLEASTVRASRAESRFAELEATVVEDPGESELAQLEVALRERGRVILELNAELARRERMITQLVLGERLGGESAELEHKLDELARDVARRHGELEARGWRIQELESALAAVAKPPGALL